MKTDDNKREKLLRSDEDERNGFSYLDLINKVDIFPQDYLFNKHFQKNVYHLQTHTGDNIGFVIRLVVDQMRKIGGCLFADLFQANDQDRLLKFKPVDFETRNEMLHKLASKLRYESDLECLKGWRNERYSVYSDKKPYVLVERALSGVLGIITYGVHVNGYVFDETSKEIKFWIPRRSASKPTWPLMLDNIVAGGIGYPYGIHETVIKESMEEANLPQSLVEESIKPVGIVSYFHFQGDIENDNFESESSFITGEVEYLYDMELTAGVFPKPNDDEVESFELLSLQETINALKNKEFKPNCGLIMVEFLIRHSYITPENEPNYVEIINKIHRTLPFPTRS